MYQTISRRLAWSVLPVSLSCLPVMAQPGTPAKSQTNAALAKYGARISVDAGPGVVKDKNTAPSAIVDGNSRSRYVLTGAPYTINIDMPFKVHVDKLSFIQSGYATETAPKDLEITLDDGQKIPFTMQLIRPERKNPGMQDVAIDREVKSLKITVLSNHPGQVKWGGMGEINIWTSTDLDSQFKLANHDPKAPVFVHTTAPVATGSQIKVTLPAQAAPGEHPRILFTPKELQEFKTSLPKSERGKATLEGFMKMAETYVAMKPSFPSVEDTVANKADKQHGSLSNRSSTLGFAYGLTGDEKYAKAARDILVGYAERYESYPRHSGRNRADNSKIMFQRLSEAMWAMPLIEAYDFIYKSPALSAEDHKIIETGLIRPVIAEIRRKEPAAETADRDRKDPEWRNKTPELAERGEYPNWLNFYDGATLMAGVVLDDKPMIDLAAAGFRTAIARGIGADGMWGEGAIGYQLFAMSVMAPSFETAARNGIDLWSVANGRFKQLFDSPLRYAYPDGTMPGINDSGRGKLGSWQTMVYDYGYLRYGDPRYAFLVNESPRQLHNSEGIYQPTKIFEKLPEPPAVKADSTLFESLGYSIMRDDTKYALMDYGTHGGVHGHYDKLNLILFAGAAGAKGDEVGGEPKFHRYEDALHSQWTVQTIAHNTMTVDQHSQLANDGKLLVYEAAPGIKIMRAESTGSYPGVLMDRTVVTLPDAVIDVYTGRSNVEHTWDRTFRYDGKLAGLPVPAADAKPWGNGDGYQHITVAKTASAAEQWQGTWENNAGKFNVTLAGAPNQQLVLGQGPDKDEMAFSRQTGKTAAFGAVYGLDGWKNDVVSAKWVSQGSETTPAVLEVAQKDGTITRVFVANTPGEWNASGWKSDARVLTVRQKGAEVKALIAGGTFAQNAALDVRKNQPGNYLVQKDGAKVDTVSAWTPGPASPVQVAKAE